MTAISTTGLTHFVESAVSVIRKATGRLVALSSALACRSITSSEISTAAPPRGPVYLSTNTSAPTQVEAPGPSSMPWGRDAARGRVRTRGRNRDRFASGISVVTRHH